MNRRPTSQTSGRSTHARPRVGSRIPHRHALVFLALPSMVTGGIGSTQRVAGLPPAGLVSSFTPLLPSAVAGVPGGNAVAENSTAAAAQHGR